MIDRDCHVPPSGPSIKFIRTTNEPNTNVIHLADVMDLKEEVSRKDRMITRNFWRNRNYHKVKENYRG